MIEEEPPTIEQFMTTVENSLPVFEEEKPKPGEPGYNPFDDENSPFAGLSPTWKPTKDRPVPTLRCQRIKPDGNQCGSRGIRGMGLETGVAFCRMHGGSLPSVKKYSESVVEAAKMRLLEYTPDAVEAIAHLLRKHDTADNVRLAAAKEVLDRAGVRAGVDVSVEVTQNELPSEKIMKKLASMRKADEPETVDEPPLEDLGESHDEEAPESGQ